jgi:hypothetical protein
MTIPNGAKPNDSIRDAHASDNDTIVPTAEQAVAAALIALRKFKEKQERLKVFDKFDTAIAGFESKAIQAAAPGTEAGRLSSRVASVARAFFFLLRVNETKVHLIAQALISAAEQENSLVFAAMTRSLIEHLAAINYQKDRLVMLVTTLAGQSQPNKIDRILDQAHESAKRSYYGKNPKGQDVGEKAYTIADLMESLQKQVPDIGDVYSYLSDFVHPNWGSNLIVSTGELGKGDLNPPLQFHHAILRKVCGYCILALREIEDTSKEATYHLVALQDVVDRALLPGATTASLFSVRTPKAVGDGKSAETAISFPTARTHGEAVSMIYNYLKDNRIEIFGPKRLEGIVDGYIIDVFETSRGELYFRTNTELSSSQ